MWDNNKKYNIYVTGVPQGKEETNSEKVLKEIMIEPSLICKRHEPIESRSWAKPKQDKSE